MKPSLFITGAGGFLGKHLLAKLDTSRYETVYCLELLRENVQLPTPRPKNIRIIEGDLLDADTYREALESADTVIHMAAVTGKVYPKTYFKVNAYGTMLLLNQCKEAGVKNFLFISTIAVSFKNKYRYFYAHSKEQAESYVKNSGLRFAILRPTMLMGKGSPVFQGLAQLAGLPVIPVFGKGDNLLQPVYVEDLAKAIRHIDEQDLYHGQVLELGGPQEITTTDFLKAVARKKGKENPKTLHLPMGLTVFGLSILERVAYGLLPLTVGQLASFRNNVTAEDNKVQKKLAPLMMGIEKIIASGLETEPPSEVPEQLQKECGVFGRYLVGRRPNRKVLEAYGRCHEKIDFQPRDLHDKLLLKLASISPLFTRSADVYSRFFRPNSTVRRKLAYLVGILEVTPSHFRFYDGADGTGKLGFLVKLGIRGVTMLLHLLFSAIFLLPAQILFKRSTAPEDTEKTEAKA